MNSIIATALLVSGIFVQQQISPVAPQLAPVSYIVEMKIYDADESLKLNGNLLVNSAVLKPGESASIEADKIKLVSSSLIRTIEGMPGMVGNSIAGAFTGYRVLFVPDEDDLLVSFRHMTWRQENDSSVELDKTVRKAVAGLMQSGGTWFVRLDEDTVVSIKITEMAETVSTRQEKSTIQIPRDVHIHPETGQERRVSSEVMIAATYRKAAKSALTAGDYSITEKAARDGLAVMPGDINLLRLRGEALIRLGLNSEALRVFNEVNESQNDSASFTRIGLLMARLGQTNESLYMTKGGILEKTAPASYKDSIRAPKSQMDLEEYWLTATGLQSELYANDEESIYYYTKAQELRRQNLLVNMRLGKIHMRKKNYEKSADCYIRVKTGPESVVLDASQQFRIATDRAAKAAKSGVGG